MNYVRMLILFSAMILTACTTPAHKNTWGTDYDEQSILVRVYGKDIYEIDGFVMTAEALDVQIKSLVNSRRLNKMFIDEAEDATLLEQVAAIHIGEKYGLKTYQVTLLGADEISSKKLLTEHKDNLDNDSEDFEESEDY